MGEEECFPNSVMITYLGGHLLLVKKRQNYPMRFRVKETQRELLEMLRPEREMRRTLALWEKDKTWLNGVHWQHSYCHLDSNLSL